MKTLSILLQSKAVQLSGSAILALLWGFFAYVHLLAYQKTGDWRYLLFCASETLSIGFFLFRTVPKSVSTNFFDWLLGIGGTFTVLLLTPADWALLPLGKHLIVIGIATQILGLVSLNRSYALVPAKREIKTNGMYQFVRHPLYTSYVIVVMGYVLVNTTWWNLGVCIVTLALLVSRAVREEKHLMRDPDYRSYMSNVRYRLIPFMF